MKWLTLDQHNSEELSPPTQPLLSKQPDRHNVHQEYAVHRGSSSSDDGILYQGTDGLDFAPNFKTRKGLGIVH